MHDILDDDDDEFARPTFWPGFSEKIKNIFKKRSNTPESENGYLNGHALDDHFIQPEIQKPMLDETSDLRDWLEFSMQNYAQNQNALNELYTELALENAAIDHDDQQKESIVSTLMVDIFERPVIDKLVNETGLNISKNDFGYPPILDSWHIRHPASDYNFVETILGRPYQLRIISRLPVSALSFMHSGDYVNAYRRINQSGQWCYPDRRLQGRPLDFEDEIAKEFSDFERVILAKTAAPSDRTIISSPNDQQVALFTLGYLFDTIPKDQMPTQEKVIDICSAAESGKKIYLVLRVADHEFKGESFPLWHQASDSLYRAVQGHAAVDIFKTSTPISIAATTELARTKLFDMNPEVIMKVIKSVFEQVSFNIQNLPSADDDSLSDQQERLFRNAVLSYLWNLVNQYKAKIKRDEDIIKGPSIQDPGFNPND